MPASYSSTRLRGLYHRMPGTLRNAVATGYSLRRRIERFGPEFDRALAELEASTALSREEHLADQERRLHAHVRYAMERVPHYRRAFAAAGYRGPPDALERIPPLSKEAIRESGRALAAEGFRGRVVKTRTSGTTGTGLRLAIDRAGYQRSYACLWYHYSWLGVRRGDRVATMAGHPVAPTESMRPPFWVRDHLEHELLCSSQHLTERTLPLYADAMARFRPSVIRGYPSSIYLLARHLLDAGRRDLRPTAVVTSSETLFDFQRSAIEAAFGCRVLSYYSNAERAAHILECREGRFHVLGQACLVEVRDDDGRPVAPGQEGQMICTELINSAMPLIRYQIGDRAIIGRESCPCGVNTPVLDALVGRIDDIVVTPDGRHVGRLDHAFKDTGQIREAQIVQEELGSITVRVVPRRGYCEREERVVTDELRRRLGDEIEVRVEQVDELERGDNGKLRLVVSHLPISIGIASDQRVR